MLERALVAGVPSSRSPATGGRLTASGVCGWKVGPGLRDGSSINEPVWQALQQLRVRGSSRRWQPTPGTPVLRPLPPDRHAWGPMPPRKQGGNLVSSERVCVGLAPMEDWAERAGPSTAALPRDPETGQPGPGDGQSTATMRPYRGPRL
jgi:hypothetical protein